MPEAASATAAVVGVLLAAGASTRFGGDKLAAPVQIGGVACTVLQASAQALRSGSDAVLAVTRPGSPHSAALRAWGCTVIEAEHAAQGMGASLAAAAQALQSTPAFAKLRGCLVMLADLPFVQSSSVKAVRQALDAGASLVVPRHARTPGAVPERGHPVGFAAAHLPALAALRGDQGAKAVLQAHTRSIVFIDLADPGILHDVDTPQALQAPPPLRV